MTEQLTLAIEPSPMTQREAFIQYMEMMDIDMLDALLEREKYMDMWKAVFFRKLNGAFEMMKEMGDTRLKAQRGVCVGKICEHFYERGLDFVGNKSNYRISLVISSTNGLVTDISECHRFINPKIPKYDVSKVIVSFMP